MNDFQNNENNNQILDNNIINQNNINYINQIDMSPMNQMVENQPVTNQIDDNQINMNQMNNNQIFTNQINDGQANMNMINYNEFNNNLLNNQDNMNTPLDYEMNNNPKSDNQNYNYINLINNTPMDSNQNYNNINQINNTPMNVNTLCYKDMNQINNNQFNMNNLNQYNLTPELNMDNIYLDEYPEIKEEEKKLIIFSNNDKKKIKVKIPKSFRSNELYSIAEKYKMYKYSDIQLFHNEVYLNNKEIPIDKIQDGDEIVIAENLESINSSYYKEYNDGKYRNKPKINVIFTFLGNKKVMPFIEDTTIKEIIKIYFIEEKIPEKAIEKFNFLHSSNSLNINDESTLREKSSSGLEFLVEVNETKQIKSFKGKKIKISVKVNKKIISEIYVGTLDKIADFYYELENSPLIGKDIIEKVMINGKEIKKYDERTFDVLGIRKDSSCNIKYKSDNYSLFKNCLII